jgi:hypothetical protein
MNYPGRHQGLLISKHLHTIAAEYFVNQSEDAKLLADIDHFELVAIDKVI